MARETLYTLMLSIARRVMEPFEGTATGGSATTLVDSARSEADDFFNVGSLFFKGGGQALYSVEITDFENATGTFTFTTKPYAGGADPAATDKYAAFRGILTREEIIGAIIEVLRDIGMFPQVRTLDQNGSDKLVFVANQTDYPVGTPGGTNPWEMGISNIKDIEFRGASTNPDEEGWHTLAGWNEVDGLLLIDPENLPLAGDEARLFYDDYHATLDTDDDFISPDVNRSWVLWKSIEMLLQNRWQANGHLDRLSTDLLKQAQGKIAELYQFNPSKKKREHTSKPKTAGW